MRAAIPALAAIAAVCAAPVIARADVINIQAVAGYSQTVSPVVTEVLGAGTYSVSNIGLASGGAYDAYTIYAPTANNLAYKDDWYININGVQTWQNTNSAYNTAGQALAAYDALPALTFTLAGTTSVYFYLQDLGYPYYADDSGGVSLNISQVAVPEPASFAMLGMGLLGMTLVARRRAAR